MIIKPKSGTIVKSKAGTNGKPGMETAKPVQKSLTILFVLSFTASLLVLAWVLKDQDETVSVKVSSDREITAAKSPEVLPPKTIMSSSRDAERTSANRIALAEQNNVIARDALKIGEEQARSLQRELDEKPDMSAQERSNIVASISRLESGTALNQ